MTEVQETIEHRNLPAFARWFLSQPLLKLRSPANAAFTLVTNNGSRVEGLTLYSRGEYQAELFNIVPTPGGSAFPPHSHPNVDSIEYFLAGHMQFRMGALEWPDELVFGQAPDGASALCGTIKRVRPGQFHGGDITPAGGTFISIQRWLHGVKPSSVVLDWIGPPHQWVRRGDVLLFKGTALRDC